MEIGIDSFAAKPGHGEQNSRSDATSINQLLEKVEAADKAGLHVFGIGEHHRQEFLDASPTVILAAAAARTKRIKLTSAVTVLSAADPVRAFQDFATLDLISGGRAEMVVGRGSFTDAFPLFGYQLKDYDALFAEKLDLLLNIRENEVVNWSGQFRPKLTNQPVFPRPLQKKLPIWLGVGGTPQSFARAGSLGLPLMVAIIGGETAQFRPLVDLYRKAGAAAGFAPEELTVGIHSLGYVAETLEAAIDEFYPGYARSMTKIGRERGWLPMNRQRYESQLGKQGALVVGDPNEVAEKILRHSEALGGISRFSFQMDIGGVSHDQFVNAIALIGEKVIPIINGN